MTDQKRIIIFNNGSSISDKLSDQSSNLSLKYTIESKCVRSHVLHLKTHRILIHHVTHKCSKRVLSRVIVVVIRVERCRKVVWASVCTEPHPVLSRDSSCLRSLCPILESTMILCHYAQAGFDMKEVFNAQQDDRAGTSLMSNRAIMIQEVSEDEIQGFVKQTHIVLVTSFHFVALLPFVARRYRSFAKKGFTLGVFKLGQAKSFKARNENALKSSSKRDNHSEASIWALGVKKRILEETYREIEEDPCEQNFRNGIENPKVKIQLEMPLTHFFDSL
ncbi:hypothetical protein NC651_022172 [Populus alba x Populus x berolinensis]|nr:hypothetical protein NC651_022172 [Populus alba x Populus x berolinensis]